MRTESEYHDKHEIPFLRKMFPPRVIEELFIYNYVPVKEPKEAESLFIYGDVETGKTLYAASLLVKQNKYDYLNVTNTTCLFASFSEILKDIRSSYSEKGNSENEILKKYTQTDVLVIDDFLTSKITDWVYDTLYYIINSRYEYLKRTIITSNNSLEEIEEILLDQRITRRINKMCKIIKKDNLKL